MTKKKKGHLVKKRLGLTSHSEDKSDASSVEFLGLDNDTSEEQSSDSTGDLNIM